MQRLVPTTMVSGTEFEKIVKKLHELASDIRSIANLFTEEYRPDLLKHIERWRKKLDVIERRYRKWLSR